VSPEETLREVFGLQGFRPGQADVVQAQLAGRDVLSVAPTGSGKSISYWVPALLQGGTTIVVSPLIALMKDQVDRLHSHGVAATFVNSSVDRSEQWRRLQAARAGQVKLLYLAPERFSREGFVGVLNQLTVSRFVVDEAHCISTWGHDFRPDYRLLGRAIEACRRPPIAAFTATATPQVRIDIARSLGLQDPVVSVTGFHRPGLLLEARRCRNDEEKLQVVRQRLEGEQGRALVYCATVRATEELAAELRRWGHRAAAYHAQLEEEPRRRIQEEFASGRLRVVAATIAFGMGVDISDIRQVIHFHLPASLEGYYQEAGRAGRDGRPARCLLLWRPADRDIQSFLVERTFEQAGSTPEAEERRNHGYAKLQLIHGYANLRTCRHARIADYFGEEGVARACSACDNCLDTSRPAEVPVEAERVRAALGGIGRHHGRLGAANVAAILAGADTRWLRDRPWAMQKPAYGALGDWSQDRVRALISELVEGGLVRQSAGEYPTLLVTEEGRDVLLRRREPEITLPALAPPVVRSAASNGRPELTTAEAGSLFDRLRRWRTDKAREQGVPAYVILPDRALAELATRRPTTPDTLLAVNGIGPTKLDRYGAELLTLLSEPPPA
jgi:ATP-dependent DNA helicase RecQ